MVPSIPNMMSTRAPVQHCESTLLNATLLHTTQTMATPTISDEFPNNKLPYFNSAHKAFVLKAQKTLEMH